MIPWNCFMVNKCLTDPMLSILMLVKYKPFWFRKIRNILFFFTLELVVCLGDVKLLWSLSHLTVAWCEVLEPSLFADDWTSKKGKRTYCTDLFYSLWVLLVCNCLSYTCSYIILILFSRVWLISGCFSTMILYYCNWRFYTEFAKYFYPIKIRLVAYICGWSILV